MSRKIATARKLDALEAILSKTTSALIVVQDNPDPDALAAAMAFRELAHRLGKVRCSVSSGGTVGRAENRALVHYLDLKLRPFAPLKLERFDLIVLLDTQPGTGNNALPADVVPDIVIDHHPLHPRTRRVRFRDLRPRCGATSTILFDYLIAAGIEPDARLATALLYGIRSDTQDFGRESTRADTEAFGALYPLANKRMLGEIQRGRVPSAYFSMLETALDSALVCGSSVLSALGPVSNPDMIAEVADLLLRHEEVNWSLCWGYHAERLLLSIRTNRSDKNAASVIRRIVGRKGTGGGHRSMAGGQIPVHGTTDAVRKKQDPVIRRRFLKATENEDAPCRKLV
jgi:nanoRNase/pAp phosphatase (c-di-AMP/oligoRNAs hydrolase)